MKRDILSMNVIRVGLFTILMSTCNSVHAQDAATSLGNRSLIQLSPDAIDAIGTLDNRSFRNLESLNAFPPANVPGNDINAIAPHYSDKDPVLLKGYVGNGGGLPTGSIWPCASMIESKMVVSSGTAAIFNDSTVILPFEIVAAGVSASLELAPGEIKIVSLAGQGGTFHDRGGTLKDFALEAGSLYRVSVATGNWAISKL